jgi:hypothetical protein
MNDELKTSCLHLIIHRSEFIAFIASSAYGAKRWRYSSELRKALTISACMKSPSNWFSLPNQKS